MQIDLIVRKESDPNSYTISCDLAERLVFGRSIASPVNFDGSQISREHFALVSRNGQVCVQDLSSNGTLVNGRPAPQKRPQKLTEGDVISVPGYEIELVKRPPASPAYEPPHLPLPSPEIDKAGLRWFELFTPWEITVVTAAIASFALIIYCLLLR